MANAAGPVSRPSHVWRAILLAVSAAWALELAIGFGGHRVRLHISNVGLTLIALISAALLAQRASLERGRARLVWTFLAGASCSWGLGQMVWTIYESILDQQPFPSLADVGYLGLIPFAIAALVTVPDLRASWASRLRLLTDAAVITVATSVISYVVLLRDLFGAPSDSRLAQAIGLTYPIADIVCISFAMLILSMGRSLITISHRCVVIAALGIASFAVGDSGFAVLNLKGTYYSGHLIDLGWYGGFLLLGLAALTDRHVQLTADDDAAPVAETQTVATASVPYIAILALLITDVVLFVRDGKLGYFVGIATLIVLALVSTRQWLTLRENAKLTSYLEERVDERTSEVVASSRRFRSLVAHSSDVVLVVDSDGRVSFVSDAIGDVFGLDSAHLIGAPIARLLQIGEVPRVLEDLATASREPLSTRMLQFQIKAGDGRWRTTETVVTSLVDDPDVKGLVLNTRDVTERRELEERLRHQAFHDGLTRLANRALFREHVSHALAVAQRNSSRVAVLFCDLDGFKSVNDTLGHSAGDRLLQDMAKRLTATVRAGDTVARLGGDEFAVLLEEVRTDEEVNETAQRIIDAVAEPFEINNRTLRVQTSVGISVADPAGGEHITVEELLRNADLAMYRAKSERGGRFAWFESSMHATLVARVREEDDLRRALEGGQLVLHYQPTFELRTGRMVGTEALLRWNHPVRGMVSPNDFIPMAEETDLIVPIGRWVIEEATRQLAEWLALDPESSMTMSVNVSGRQLLVGDLADTVSYALQATGVPASKLIIELTESMLLDSSETTTSTLRAIRASGVRIAIDDFGTGYSSLSYLSRFPVDLLKVDRSFVDRLGSSHEEGALARSIVQLGHSLSLTTVAEGIEEGEQLRALQAMGCEYGQGFYFAKPLPPAEVSRMLHVREPFGSAIPKPAIVEQLKHV